VCEITNWLNQRGDDDGKQADEESSNEAKAKQERARKVAVDLHRKPEHSMQATQLQDEAGL